jgi:glycosyltransferase involved in cell wall biosynthesis
VRARLRGKKVLFWSHGWLRRESFVRRILRNLYFGLGSGVLVYSDRARELAVSTGFPGGKVHPIYNSLDWDAQNAMYHRLKDESLESLRRPLALPLDRPVLASVSRLTDICRYDLLLDAAKRLEVSTGAHPVVVLIGSGPAAEALRARADILGVDLRMPGPIYDEELLSRYVMAADVIVSPGKVGLTAMHGLTYGTPVVSHGDLDNQMPEVEAIIPSISGEFFLNGSPEDLASSLQRVLTYGDRAERRKRCRRIIEERYTPQKQMELIDAAVDGVLHA